MNLDNHERAQRAGTLGCGESELDERLQPFAMHRFQRLTGLGAVIGGTAWVVACLALASLPSGCVGDDCERRPERDWTPFATTWFVVAAALVTASAVGLVVLALRRSSGSERLAFATLACGAIGVTLLVTGVVLSALDVPGMGDAMPGFVLSAAVACVVAALLTAWLVVRSQLVPVWLAVLLAVATTMLLGANEQTDTILLAMPFGVTWALAGILLLRGSTIADEPAAGTGPAT